MDAIFFATDLAQALGVSTYDDLPVDAAGEPLRVPSPADVLVLVELLGGDRARQSRPVRDATCRSFPIWDMGPRVVERIASASDLDLDRIAEAWLAALAQPDTDAFELATLLGDVRDALADRCAESRLFVLLEERADSSSERSQPVPRVLTPAVELA